MRYLSNIHSIIICKLKICIEKTQFQKIGILVKKYSLNQKRWFEIDSKVRKGNLTKVLDFSAFEKFDFTYKENISIILEDYWGENRNQ